MAARGYTICGYRVSEDRTDWYPIEDQQYWRHEFPKVEAAFNAAKEVMPMAPNYSIIISQETDPDPTAFGEGDLVLEINVRVPDPEL
jgi:hypothetical protein